MSLWWLRPGWTDARCSCGAKIWPEGDPDWGACYTCFSAQFEEPQFLEPPEDRKPEIVATPRDIDLPF